MKAKPFKVCLCCKTEYATRAEWSALPPPWGTPYAHGLEFRNCQTPNADGRPCDGTMSEPLLPPDDQRDSAIV